MLFVASVVATAAAAVGPIFLRAGDLSILASNFGSASAGQQDVVVLANGGSKEFARLAGKADAAARRAGGLLERPTLTAEAGSSFTGQRNQHYRADLLARSNLCRHLHFTRGRCPTGAGEIAVSARSARAAGITVGSRRTVGVAGRRSTASFTVAGIYRPPSSVENPYWGGTNYFEFGTGLPGLQQLDPFVGSFRTVLGFASVTAPALAADIPWSPRAPFAGEHALESVLHRTVAQFASDPSFHESTGFGTIAAKATAGANSLRSIMLAVVLQLVLLVLVVVYALARATAVSRRGEAEFARRHGFTRPAMFALAIGEPAALIVAALPLGLLIAWAVTDVVSRSFFVAGTPVRFDVWSVVAAVGVSVAGILAVALASVDLWRRADVEGSRRAALTEVVLDVSAIVLALAGLLALATQGSLDASHTDALALLAPSLLALGAGVIALRLALVLIALAIKSTSDSPRIASFLALRELGRRPALLRQALPLAAAVTICLFAVGSYTRAASNRSLLANFEVGAGRVVDVSVRPGFDLERAVRRADPSGRQAMAAEVYRSSYGRLLAVDSKRLSEVATWPHGLTAQAADVIARRLSPPEPPPVVVRGDAVRLTLAVPRHTPAVSLVVGLYDVEFGSTSTLELGPVEPGRHVYSAPLNGDCPRVCRVLDLSPSWENPSEHFRHVVRIGLLGVSGHAAGGTWRPVPYGSAATWTATTPGTHVEGSTARRGVVFAAPGALVGESGGVIVAPASTVVHVPAVVTSTLAQLNPPAPPANSVSLQDLDGNPLTVEAIAVAPTLPLLGTNGAMVDLRLAERALTGPPIDSTAQIWLSDSAGPGILRALRGTGVRIGTTRRASTVQSGLDRSGTALGYDLMLIISPIAALLALGTIMFNIVADGQRRRGELRSLAVAGIPGRLVRRSLLLENAAVLGTALVVGTAIGFAALALALPSLPEFVSGTNSMPISNGVPFATIVAAALCLVVVFTVTAGSTSWLVLARRSAQEAN
ncbi:MAG TPA: FtsX-like permease family protein [Gaiellaceae bacterium]